MNVVNGIVNHRQFGEGKVIKQTAGVVSVKFSKQFGTKKFIYPGAFVFFLELSDTDLRGKVADELRQISDQAAAEHKLVAEESELLQKELRKALTIQKRAAAKRNTATKKAPAKPKKQVEAGKI